MRTFKFQLESVLLLREREEQKSREEYGRALQSLALAEQALCDRERLRDEVGAALAERRKQGFHAAEQGIFWSAIQQHETACKRLAEIVANAKADAARRRAAMLLARRNHEMLLHLKSKRQLTHETAERRAEELLIDDMAGARHAKNSREVAA